MEADANQPSGITVAFHGTGSFYSVVKRVQKIGAFFLANIAYL
jgi:hypothetical protein